MINKIDELIKKSMKEGDSVRTRVLRSIKTELTNSQKSGKEYSEVSVLNKMKKQREDSILQYNQAGRNDLASEEINELNIINEFLPRQATEKEIYEAIYEVCLIHGFIEIEKVDCGSDEYIPVKYMSIPKQSMGLVIKEVKANLDNVDGKQLSEIVKQHIKK